ncbi:MAG: hypothetical protein AVDCRST_MAG19-1002 [uncultured Thermomicrobiales bacterium]|uniref:Uncharacterized protein n=1 Tax=uncultured Thermomicrobiales bacterium TaxID=1645740 RepID=A0A6J4UKR5_9BACT|nr:MAG: hypothetical protein AVDCRST_MAG19-1002 [uncultured Thermomicrobiales bacterium]
MPRHAAVAEGAIGRGRNEADDNHGSPRWSLSDLHAPGSPARNEGR